VERCVSIHTFVELFHPVVRCLQHYSQSNTDSNTVKAASLLHSLKTSEFLVSLPIMKPLSEQLQAVNTDLFKTLANIRAVQTNLNNKRINTEAEFHRLFESATKFAEFLDVDIKKPRTVSR